MNIKILRSVTLPCIILIYTLCNYTAFGEPDNNIHDTVYVHSLHDSVINNLESYDEALNFAKEALQISTKLNYKKGIAKSNFLFGKLNRKHLKHAEAIKHFKIALTLFKELNFKEEIIDTYLQLGESYNYISDNKMSLQYFEKGMALIDTASNKNDLANFKIQISNCYQELSKYEEALHEVFQARLIYTKLHNNKGLAIAANILGVIYYNLEEINIAIVYFKEALYYNNLEENSGGISTSLANIGGMFKANEQFDSAIVYLNKSLQNDIKRGDNFGICANLANIGDIYRIKGNYSDARKNFRRAQKIADEIEDIYLKEFIYFQLANLEKEEGNFAKAEFYATESLKMQRQVGNPKSIYETSILLNEIYMGSGKYKEANKCIIEAMEIKDSLFSVEKNKQILEIQARYENLNNKLEIKSLINENKLQAKTKNTLIITIFTGGLSLIVLIVLVFIIRKSRNKSIKQGKYFEDLLTNSDEFIFVIDKHTKLTYISPSFEIKLGYMLDEAIGQSLLEYIHPDDIDLLQQIMDNTLLVDVPYSLEFRVRTATNNWVVMAAIVKSLISSSDNKSIVVNAWDITERKHLEGLLIEKRKELEDSQILAKMGSWKLDINNGTITASKELMAIKGERSEEISFSINEYISKYLRNEDMGIFLEKINLAKEKSGEVTYKDKFEGRVKIINPPGIAHVVMWAEVVKPGIIQGVTQDVSELRRAEKLVVDSEKSFRELFNYAADAILILDNEGKVIDMNIGAELMYGYKKSELYGKSTDPLVVQKKANLAKAKKYFNKAYNGTPQQFEFDGLRKNGAVFPRLVRMNPGEYLGEAVVIIFSTDISELKQVEAALSKSEEKYRKIYNAFSDVYFITDFKGIINEISPSVKKLLGYKPEELVGTNSSNLYPVDDWAKLDEALKTKKELKDFSVRLMTKEKGVIDCSINLKLLQNKRGTIKGFEGVIRDISERAKIHNELKLSEEQLTKSNKTKEKILQIIGHDLLGPIGTQKGLTDIIISEGESFTKQGIMDLISSLKPALDSTYFMLENLLSWARIQRDAISYHPAPDYLKPIVEECFNISSVHALSKNINLKLNGKEDLSGYFDKNQIKIVIRNLISNAIKFTEKEGTVLVKLSINGEFAVVSVSDNGLGMTAEQLKELKSSATKNISSYGTDNEKGTGLGLILIKEFIKINEGSLNMDSELGKGTNVTFSLPLIKISN